MQAARDADFGERMFVVRAHLAALDTKGAPLERYEAKWAIVRALYRQSYEREVIRSVMRFVDWSMPMPDPLEVRFRAELATLEQEKKMPYVTSMERLARKEGRQEGTLAAKRDAIIDVLEARFGSAPEDVRVRLESLDDVAALRGLLVAAATAPDLAAFTVALG